MPRGIGILENNSSLEMLAAVLEYEPTDDAEERILEIFEYLLTPEKTLDFEK